MTEKQIIQLRIALRAAATKIGMELEDTRGYAYHKYFCGFATVAISFSKDTEQFAVERYYDSELVNHGRQVTEFYSPANLNVAIARCAVLIRTVRDDEPILGGIE